jgi:hypothetical protein
MPRELRRGWLWYRLAGCAEEEAMKGTGTARDLGLTALLLLAACGDKEPKDTGQAPEDTGCAMLWCADADGDGYGNPTDFTSGCTAPVGFVSDCSDCDDWAEASHPDADETCDGVDEDCDGAVDNAPIDGQQWYLDSDGDGYGGATLSDPACTQPADTTTTSEDCDDEDSEVHPDAEETWYDGEDSDCDGADDYDQDADGHPHSDHGGDDCDDEDAAVYPGAVDWPDDGVDADCDGADPSGVAVEVEAGDQRDWGLSLDMSMNVDLAFVLDNTGSMGSTWKNYTSMADIVSQVEAVVDTPGWGLASFADYPSGDLGNEGDLPFELLQPITTDAATWELAWGDLDECHGGDGPESGMEALVQAAAGGGYDLGCDGSYDSEQDVLPFLASTSDPFGGAGGESYDAKVPGIGTLGGMGFRAGMLPIIFLATDYDLRDPDAGYEVPGGCPEDAGHTTAVAALQDLGALLIGLHWNDLVEAPGEQLGALCEDVGSVGDLSGDGVADEPLVYEVNSTSRLDDWVLDALNQAWAHPFDETCLVATQDDAGVLTDITPACRSGVSVDDGATSFTLTLEPDSPGAVHTLEFELWGDSTVLLASETLYVVVPE